MKKPAKSCHHFRNVCATKFLIIFNFLINSCIIIIIIIITVFRNGSISLQSLSFFFYFYNQVSQVSSRFHNRYESTSAPIPPTPHRVVRPGPGGKDTEPRRYSFHLIPARSRDLFNGSANTREPREGTLSINKTVARFGPTCRVTYRRDISTAN